MLTSLRPLPPYSMNPALLYSQKSDATAIHQSPSVSAIDIRPPFSSAVDSGLIAVSAPVKALLAI